MQNKRVSARLATVHLGVLAAALLLLSSRTAVAQPLITSQPKAASVSIGATVTFRVTASGAPLTYQWQFNGMAIAGATVSSLSLTNVQVADAGDYSVVVTNAAGSTTSQPAKLTVDPTFTKITAGDLVNATGPFFGCAWVDYDNDGFADLFVTSRPGRNQLYRNAGSGKFSKLTTGAIVTDSAEFVGCTWGDYDNDAFLDRLLQLGVITTMTAGRTCM